MSWFDEQQQMQQQQNAQAAATSQNVLRQAQADQQASEQQKGSALGAGMQGYIQGKALAGLRSTPTDTPSTPAADGTGFGLGGELVKGDIGKASYAGGDKAKGKGESGGPWGFLSSLIGGGVAGGLIGGEDGGSDIGKSTLLGGLAGGGIGKLAGSGILGLVGKLVK